VTIGTVVALALEGNSKAYRITVVALALEGNSKAYRISVTHTLNKQGEVLS